MSLSDRLVIAVIVLFILFGIVALPATAVSAIFPSLASAMVGPFLCPPETTARLDNSGVWNRYSRQTLTCVAPGGRPVARFEERFRLVWFTMWVFPLALALILLSSRRPEVAPHDIFP